ncbi:hypothetical protein Y032_0428g1282 [Ancylostoma ceylanicum]|uniref:Phospholipid scramblase n=1 Tax=Ancylostoma ceylanicum TaxID=53326 RepID=A0A016X019_9BILA|nr:hypothetical protein Y032_0428g1282 [Ancylostoma ceylanicum]
MLHSSVISLSPLSSGEASYQMAAYTTADAPPPPPGTFAIQPGYGPPQMQMMPMQTAPGPYMMTQAITTQPGAYAGQTQPGAFPGQTAIWMPMPAPIDGVPAGLEYLTMVDKIMVHQMFEVLELVTGFETKNKYALRNANGEQVYYAFEESECCERQCCGPNRGFTMHIVDNFKREVLLIRRPFKCCGGACFGLCANAGCCASECTVESPPGNVIGTVTQRGAFCAAALEMKDADDKVILRVEGPCCCMMCGCQDKEFPVDTTTGENIGSITKKWGGCLREAYTDADVFSVTFPLDLDVRAKAVLLGATFLIDFMQFEQPKNNNS